MEADGGAERKTPFASDKLEADAATKEFLWFRRGMGPRAGKHGKHVAIVWVGYRSDSRLGERFRVSCVVMTRLLGDRW